MARPNESRGRMILTGIGFTMFAIVADTAVLRVAWRQLRTRDYHAAPATIIRSDPAPTGKGAGHTDVRYRYEAGGAEHTGTRLRHVIPIAPPGGWAYDSPDEYPVGRSVTAYYDPANPSDAVLQRGVGGYDLKLLLLLLPFNLLPVTLVWARWRTGAGRRVPGLVREEPGALVTRVWLTRSSPVGCLLLLTALWSFAVAIVSVFVTDRYPPLRTGVAAWAVALAPALVLAMLMATTSTRRSKQVPLVIDDRRRVVELPPAGERRDVLSVPRDRVEAVTVTASPPAPPGAPDDPTKPIPKWRSWRNVSLEWRGDDGQRRADVLEEVMDPDHAEDIAAWLRRRLKLPPSS